MSLNYHHLLCVWTVTREGGVVRAAKALKVTQPTVSSHIRSLEDILGEPLFSREGRRLVPTDVGRVVADYADEIFSLGRELVDTVRTRSTGRRLRLAVGIADGMSKLVTHRLLEPAMQLGRPVHLVCREDRVERLLAALALHELDLVLSDVPVPPTVNVKAFNHLLGECHVTAFAQPALARRLRRGFPDSLAGIPLLLPSDGTALRRLVTDWLRQVRVDAVVAGEFDDFTLIKVFGEVGAGVLFVPSAVAAEVRQRYRLSPIAEIPTIRERFYAISAERRIQNPAVTAVTEAARATLFG
ncbi:MAG: transcriptional activator NhaR [Acidobacteria bacterium]|nr:transcriptional activator NhaR [Acidobacteriota bacterium]